MTRALPLSLLILSGCITNLPEVAQPCAEWEETGLFKHTIEVDGKTRKAFVFMPGGYGTLDEVFETVTLVQTGKIERFPLVLMGSDYWDPLLEFLRDTLQRRGAASEGEVDAMLTDQPAEVVAQIRDIAGGART